MNTKHLFNNSLCPFFHLWCFVYCIIFHSLTFSNASLLMDVVSLVFYKFLLIMTFKGSQLYIGKCWIYKDIWPVSAVPAVVSGQSWLGNTKIRKIPIYILLEKFRNKEFQIKIKLQYKQFLNCIIQG